MSAVVEVEAPRLVERLPEEEYFSHPALSASGMKALLRSPRYFRMMQLVPREPKTEFDMGHAVHSRVLGVGQPVVEIPSHLLASNGALSTKDAKAFVEDARENGQVPLKPKDYQRFRSASDAILMNTKARELLEREGKSEVSLFATDPVTGVGLRSRLDRLAMTFLDPIWEYTPIDIKTTTDVRRRSIERAIVDFGYDLQAEVYRELIRLVTGTEPGPMHLIFTEKDPPYEVRVVRLADPVWHEGGQRKMRAAIDLFAWCSERGVWPGDDEDGGPIADLEPPHWYRMQNMEVV